MSDRGYWARAGEGILTAARLQEEEWKLSALQSRSLSLSLLVSVYTASGGYN